MDTFKNSIRYSSKAIFVGAFLLFVSQLPSQQPAPTVDFANDVQPILKKSCYSCHAGSDPQGQFHIDNKALAMKGGASGRLAIVPGNSTDSVLIQRVMGGEGVNKMPLGGTLAAQQIAVLRTWIDQGANWPESGSGKHWAYEKPVRPAVPAVKNADWARNAIDRFILARLEKEGLKPSPQASKETLIRRVSLDLIGLPPTPAEVVEYVNDSRADAYERLVDRLLASPRYGERWATPWLDLARYGDSNGFTGDGQRVAWPYRDWVVKAFNQNMPFDQFTTEQIAGDLLPNSTVDQKIATGFIRSSMVQTEGGSDPEESKWTSQIDRASTVGTVFLGSTIGCAQCHNHKYDPFTQKQFYQMVAFFSNNVTGVTKPRKGEFRGALTEPSLDLPTPEQAQKRNAINAELKQYEQQLNDSSAEFQKRQAEWERKVLAAENDWQALHPTKLVSTGGATITVASDGAVLASGKNPDVDTYVLDAKLPAGEITGFRIEALPDPSLPGGGPGRDFYGNFMVHDVNIETGSSPQRLSKVVIKEVLSDDVAIRILNTQTRMKQLWIVDATRGSSMEARYEAKQEGRLRVQLLLIPEKPLKSDGNSVVRLTIEQISEVSGLNMGHFRVGVSTTANPKVAVEVLSALRPILSIPLEKRSEEQAQVVAEHYRSVAVELEPTRQKIAELQGKIRALAIPSTLVVVEDAKIQEPTTYVRIRGAFESKGELVKAGIPSFLGSLPNGVENRFSLAKWLVSSENPLTARVRMNQIWENIFGRGIVETAEDFGTQGTAPSHPELLDWLATEFVARGWDQKAMQRLIVTSSTYRQASDVPADLLEKDPNNVLLARGPRFRVEAEMVRDIALAASGLLSSKMFGPPVMPHEPEGVSNQWVLSKGEDLYRRALYISVRRATRYPSLAVFDAPSREVCTARRNRSDSPLQALSTLNDPAFFEAAQAMARRILKEGGADTAARANYAFRLVTAREPVGRERDMLLSAFEKSRKYFESNLDEAEGLSGKRDPELAAWTTVSNALLNLDETLTKR